MEWCLTTLLCFLVEPLFSGPCSPCGCAELWRAAGHVGSQYVLLGQQYLCLAAVIVYRLINLLYDGRAQTLHAQSIHLTDSSCSLILLCHVVRVAIRSPNGVLGYHELRATDHQANVAFLVFSDRSVIHWQ